MADLAWFTRLDTFEALGQRVAAAARRSSPSQTA
jgi:hypothetical protein